jgi:hypothetical protein
MPPFENLTGYKCGRLIVGSEFEKRRSRNSRERYFWKCLCSCGSITWVVAFALKQQHTLSCGCQRVEAITRRNKEHPTFHLAAAKRRRHGKSLTKIHRAWKNMRQRCSNPNKPEWERYGGRGITVCPEWQESFEAFYAHVGDPPPGRYSIDRMDNNRGYEPGNVRWATDKEQAANK